MQETLEEVSQVYSAFFQYLVHWKRWKSKFNTSNDTADIMNPEEILYISDAEDYQSADVNVSLFESIYNRFHILFCYFILYYPLAQQSCGGDIGSVPYVCM